MLGEQGFFACFVSYFDFFLKSRVRSLFAFPRGRSPLMRFVTFRFLFAPRSPFCVLLRPESTVSAVYETQTGFMEVGDDEGGRFFGFLFLGRPSFGDT